MAAIMPVSTVALLPERRVVGGWGESALDLVPADTRVWCSASRGTQFSHSGAADAVPPAQAWRADYLSDQAAGDKKYGDDPKWQEYKRCVASSLLLADRFVLQLLVELPGSPGLVPLTA